MTITRRQAIYTAFFGAGGLGLRALATGLPMRILADPLRASAQTGGTPRTLILCTSSAGDPMGANVPGTYGPGAEGVAHPADPQMAPTQLTLAGQTHTAALPWSTLPQSVLDKTCFFHHATLTNVHASQPKVMRLMGAVERNEMMISMFAKTLSDAMGTIQIEPLSLGARRGSELLSFEGRVLSNVSPRGLRDTLASSDGPLADLRDLRDREIDRLHELLREHGTENQSRTLDRFTRTRDEARNISESLLGRLESIDGDDTDNQVVAAPVLAAMGVTPVITVRIPFGGDNHNDAGLARETRETVSGVAHLAELMANIETLKNDGVMEHDVVVAAMNVFGRTLEKKGTQGRDHNPHRHVTIMMGDSIRGGVVGGIEKRDRGDWGVRSIDSQSGNAVDGGDIGYEDTLGAMAKTLGVALGVDRTYLDDNISTGKVVESVVS